MKTPKEILLGRHQKVEGKLDSIRRDVLAEVVGLENSDARARSDTYTREVRKWGGRASHLGWRELLLSLRWHLAGIAALWVGVGFLNLESTRDSSMPMAQETAPSAKQLLLAARENRRQLQEIIEPGGGDPAAPSRELLRQRRSQNQTRSAFV